MRYLIFTGLILLASCSESQVEQPVNQESAQEASGHIIVGADEFKQMISQETVQLIDVRTPDECRRGMIANAVNIDWLGNSFDAEIAKLDKDKPVYVYCAAGGRSNKAAEKMIAMGFKKVVDLRGGYNAWPK